MGVASTLGPFILIRRWLGAPYYVLVSTKVTAQDNNEGMLRGIGERIYYSCYSFSTFVAARCIGAEIHSSAATYHKYEND